MKQTDALKLACATAFVAALGMGCASTGYARYDADSMDANRGVGVSAGAEMGTGADVHVNADTDANLNFDADSNLQRDTIQHDAASIDLDRTDSAGAAAGAQFGTDRDYHTYSDYQSDRSHRYDRSHQQPDVDGEARVTVSALGTSPETRATWVNKFPFYDRNWQLRTIQNYTFTPDSDFMASFSRDSDFRADLPEGSVYVEAAGGADSSRVIQHTPNPIR